jgi:hypothetical protein
MALPEPTKTPCNECPWRRDAAAGHLGPLPAEAWVALVHSDEAIACHKTIEESGNWDTPKIRQCAGAGIHRTNTFKSPRDREVWRSEEPDHEVVFSRSTEFVAHHTREGALPRV